MRVVCLYEYKELSDDARRQIAADAFRNEGARYLQQLTEESTTHSLEDDLHGFVQLFTSDDLVGPMFHPGGLFLWDGAEPLVTYAELNDREHHSDWESSFERTTMAYCTDEDVERMLRGGGFEASPENVSKVKEAHNAARIGQRLEQAKYEALAEVVDAIAPVLERSE